MPARSPNVNIWIIFPSSRSHLNDEQKKSFRLAVIHGGFSLISRLMTVPLSCFLQKTHYPSDEEESLRLLLIFDVTTHMKEFLLLNLIPPIY
ncbi:hypothetical protein NPIL_546151 [Nephila pilipes]|uniref:Uncharacterized protein n=1 Tax=Nephila pilipes TaxID=299642 RepID=A0A8X6N7G4_NEPPI|nr:hypothetical protein NPIL_546151 [Nephila pilipes]